MAQNFNLKHILSLQYIAYSFKITGHYKKITNVFKVISHIQPNCKINNKNSQFSQ